jgi:enoyl-CoA hydratase/carnithine racemase
MSVDVEVEAGVAVIRLNRPERLNAMDSEHYGLLSEAFMRVRDDRQIRAAVVTGAGDRSFSVGADLKSFIGSPPGLEEFWLTQRGQLLNRGLEVWKPVVAAVNGLCLGGGMTLLLATDIRIAASDARFAQMEINRGIFPFGGATVRLPREVGWGNAMRWLLTGEPYDAHEAHRIGLVQEVVEPGRQLDRAIELGEAIAIRSAPLGVKATLASAHRARLEGDAAAFARLEPDVVELFGTEDGREGMLSFVERREARFTGR